MSLKYGTNKKEGYRLCTKNVNHHYSKDIKKKKSSGFNTHSEATRWHPGDGDGTSVSCIRTSLHRCHSEALLLHRRETLPDKLNRLRAEERVSQHEPLQTWIMSSDDMALNCLLTFFVAGFEPRTHPTWSLRVVAIALPSWYSLLKVSSKLLLSTYV